MPNFALAYLADTGTTGNNTHSSYYVGNGWDEAIFQFVVEVAGGGATVDWKIQGSVDGSKWYDLRYLTDATDTGAVAAITVTAVGKSIIFGMRPYKFFRAVTANNTAITYRVELYLV